MTITLQPNLVPLYAEGFQSALAGTDHSRSVGLVLAGTQPASATHHLQGSALLIVATDVQIALSARVTDFSVSRAVGKVSAKASIGRYATLNMELLGEFAGDSDELVVQQTAVTIDEIGASATSEFVAYSIRALLGLADEMRFQIPELTFDLVQKFNIPLRRISQRLRMRQIAYRLMVIERATGLEFTLPSSYSAHDYSTLSYVFHAIVDREFDWPLSATPGDAPATKEALESLLPLLAKDKPSRQVLGPTLAKRTLLGHTVELGNEWFVVEDLVIDRPEEVRNELASGDGHRVNYQARSLSGKAKIKLPDAPRLPDSPWEPIVQELIDLDWRLDERLAQRYHALAASTLAGLTEEEKAEVTERPSLGEDAFVDVDPEQR